MSMDLEVKQERLRSSGDEYRDEYLCDIGKCDGLAFKVLTVGVVEYPGGDDVLVCRHHDQDLEAVFSWIENEGKAMAYDLRESKYRDVGELAPSPYGALMDLGDKAANDK